MLFHTVEKEVSLCDRAVLAVQYVLFYRTSSIHHDLHIEKEIVEEVLPAVVKNYRTKISAPLEEPYSTPFRTWYGNF